MFGKKKVKQEPVPETKPAEKPTPAFLRPDYPYQAVGDPITDLDSLADRELYELKCHQCEMSIRMQGCRMKEDYGRLMERGCIGCGNKDLVLRRVDMSSAPKADKTES